MTATAPAHSKITICVALRDRIQNLDGKGALPDDSPIHQYWADLNCLSQTLPPPLRRDSRTGSNENTVITNDPGSKAPAGTAVERPISSVSPVEKCNELKKSHCVIPGQTWGTMHKLDDQE